MKGPPETRGLTPERDHFVGDGLRVKMTTNKDNLTVEGDGCRVTLDTNSGLLRVTGDGCRIQITRNLGSVEYTGDGGRIVLGPESINREKVKYTGDGGTIEFGNMQKFKSGSSLKNVEKMTMTNTTTKRNEKDGTIIVTRVTTVKNDEDKNNARRIKAARNLGSYVNLTVNKRI